MDDLTSCFDEQQIVYHTTRGAQVAGDSRLLLEQLPDDSVDAIITSPPFALLRKKGYGNQDQHAYVQWLCEFGSAARRVLKPTGSLVIDLGGAYQTGAPTRSLYNYRVPIAFCDELGFFLAQDFYWYNPSKLPSPIEWVNKRKIRAKDSVNVLWWFSKTAYPKADVRRVLVPYSDRMLQLLKDPELYYVPKGRPSEHTISRAFHTNNGGAIPSNLLQIPNTESNSFYLKSCKALGVKPHPARFPSDLPRFFIRLLTEPDDLVLDIFSGSNTTGAVAEVERRNWLAFELERDYACLSALRFMEGMSQDAVRETYESLCTGQHKNLTAIGAERRDEDA